MNGVAGPNLPGRLAMQFGARMSGSGRHRDETTRLSGSVKILSLDELNWVACL